MEIPPGLTTGTCHLVSPARRGPPKSPTHIAVALAARNRHRQEISHRDEGQDQDSRSQSPGRANGAVLGAAAAR